MALSHHKLYSKDILAGVKIYHMNKRVLQTHMYSLKDNYTANTHVRTAEVKKRNTARATDTPAMCPALVTQLLIFPRDNQYYDLQKSICSSLWLYHAMCNPQNNIIYFFLFSKNI